MVLVPPISTVYSKACERVAKLPTCRPAVAPTAVRSARLLPDWPLPVARPTPPPTTVPTLRAVLSVDGGRRDGRDAAVLHPGLRVRRLARQRQGQQRGGHRGACKGEWVMGGPGCEVGGSCEWPDPMIISSCGTGPGATGRRAIGNRPITNANRRQALGTRRTGAASKNAAPARARCLLPVGPDGDRNERTVWPGWQRLCGASAVLRFVDINLRGVGQVMFQNHPLTGLLFIAAIAWGALAARRRRGAGRRPARPGDGHA